MSNFKSHFNFNKQERSGIFFLLLLIFCFQIIYYVVQSGSLTPDSAALVIEDKIQQEIDALKAKTFEEKAVIKYRFNPNYIDDFKGYSLGMLPDEIDNLLQYRSLGKFVNSPEEFQKVSGISDNKLKTIAPYFRFPEWRNKSRSAEKTQKQTTQPIGILPKVRDLNSATAEELTTISGVGETLSKRIIRFRDALGGFLVNEQLYDVYGLKAEVVDRTLKKFKVIHQPIIHKVNINTSGPNELASIVYINKILAQKIIAYRTQIGGFGSFDDLRAIPDFPEDKIERIKLYLSL